MKSDINYPSDGPETIKLNKRNALVVRNRTILNVTCGLVFGIFVLVAISNHVLFEKIGSILALPVLLLGFAKYHMLDMKIVSLERDLRALESEYLQTEVLPSLRPIAEEKNREFFRRAKTIRIYTSILWATLAALVAYGIYKYWKG